MLAPRTSVWFSVAVAFLISPGCGGSNSADSPAASIAGAGAANGQPTTSPGASTSVTSSPQLSAAPAVSNKELHPQVLIKTSAGDMKVRLNADKSPVTVENFLEHYVDRGFYAGTIFHHVEKGFIIIGGGYTPDRQAKAARAAIRNESDNGLKNRRATIAMARDADFADSATSQFFFNLADNTSLDYAGAAEAKSAGYCVFGEVVEGMDVVDRMAAAAVHETDTFPKMPVEPITIESIQRVK